MENREMQKVCRFPVELYLTDVTIVVGGTQKDFLKMVNSLYGVNYVDDHGDTYGCSLYESKTKTQAGGHYVWLASHVPSIEDFTTLGHELTHVAMRIFDNAGVKPDPKNDEPFAYLFAYLFSQSLTKLRLLFKGRKKMKS